MPQAVINPSTDFLQKSCNSRQTNQFFDLIYAHCNQTIPGSFVDRRTSSISLINSPISFNDTIQIA